MSGARDLAEELPDLILLARRCHDVHGPRAPGLFSQVLADVLALEDELQGEGLGRAAARLASLRDLTGDFRAPPEACTTWRTLWQGLGRLDREVRARLGPRAE